MKKLTLITIFVFLCFIAKAQVVFKTIVPLQPVIAGESFPVQYVLEDIEKNDEFTPPLFNGFQLVSGPHTYSGTINTVSGSIPSKNILFTLVAVKPGRYIIPGATAKVNGKHIKSDEAIIQVISKTEAFNRGFREEKKATVSEYFLRPEEDPYEKMRQNLFMKVMVDKKNCYVGEPVIATFKLYSRLESRSDIIKNPGFYGFAVQDMVNLNDRLITSEIINGKPFDVHTIRTVQLYPLRAGIFTIDAMEVLNRVEFSKSFVNRKTEQQIEEGVANPGDPSPNNNTVTYENSISTDKINIHVKPYPDANKPASFNGATGSFSVQAEWKKTGLAKNEEGTLIITILGKGNFTQLSAPSVQWPAGIEAFDPVIKDSLDKTDAPLKGSRAFHFPFIAGKAGPYAIPAIVFTFFDPAGNKYRTVSAEAPAISVSDQVKEPASVPDETRGADKKGIGRIGWILGALLAILVTAIALFFRKRNKVIKEKPASPEKTILVSIEELLQPVYFALKADDRRFYDLLQKAIWDYLSPRLHLSGSNINKPALYQAMLKNQFSEDQCQAILSILQQCETAIFTKADFGDDKQGLLQRTKAVLSTRPLTPNTYTPPPLPNENI